MGSRELGNGVPLATFHLPLLIRGEFVRRDNRFRAQVRVEGRTVAVHVANSGRLGELLMAGREVWLAPADLQRNPHRRTAYDLALVEFEGRLVSVDARLPGRLVGQALGKGRLVVRPGSRQAGFEVYETVRSEARRGKSRLDFYLESSLGQPPCWIEVKSVTLVQGGVARFPDAPTLRGQRHVRELMRAVQEGQRAAVIFVVQREDAERLAPHDVNDPDFGRALRQAARAGVELYAWRCRVRLDEVQLADAIPVQL